MKENYSLEMERDHRGLLERVMQERRTHRKPDADDDDGSVTGDAAEIGRRAVRETLKKG